MNISKKEVDALNLLVTLEITPEDYQEKVNGVLENYRKRANIPGFRPGKVPMGLIKKQYGKSVLIDEINKILQDGIYNYITQKKNEHQIILEKKHMFCKKIRLKSPKIIWLSLPDVQSTIAFLLREIHATVMTSPIQELCLQHLWNHKESQYC